MEQIFSILQNEDGEITREDLEFFVQEAESNIKDRGILSNSKYKSPTSDSKLLPSMQWSTVDSPAAGSQLVQEHEAALRQLYDTLNIIIHKVDELRQMKHSKDGQVLLGIIFKLTTDVIKGVGCFDHQLEKFQDHFDAATVQLDTFQREMRRMEQDFGEFERNLLNERYLHSETQKQLSKARTE